MYNLSTIVFLQVYKHEEDADAATKILQTTITSQVNDVTNYKCKFGNDNFYFAIVTSQGLDKFHSLNGSIPIDDNAVLGAKDQ